MIEELLREAALYRAKRRRMKQSDVAAIMGVTQSRISDIENYRGNPSIELIGRYLHAIGTRLTFVPHVSPPFARAGIEDPANVVSTELAEFNWGNFGLDAVEDADPEWAEVLAERIVYVLRKKELLP